MERLGTVAIIGVGLIGGSIGQALRLRGLANRVVGIGRRRESLDRAVEVGAIDVASLHIAKGVDDAELVIVCSPVDLIAEHAEQAAAHCRAGALVTDAGSTKQSIVERLDGNLPRGCRFVGSHPIAGSEKTGPEHARPDLFEGRNVIVTPATHTKADDCRQIAELWTALGARVTLMTAEEHDRALAASSHLPHAVAAALAAALPAEDFPVAGSGFLDTSRLAAGSPLLWRQIFLDNRDNLLESLDRFQLSLGALRRAIQNNDATAVEEFLAAAKKNRDALGS